MLILGSIKQIRDYYEIQNRVLFSSLASFSQLK
jgi:hypothetical protein